MFFQKKIPQARVLTVLAELLASQLKVNVLGA